jgi:hypothetical protein
MPLLPSPCTPHDVELLLKTYLRVQPDLRIFGSILTTKTFMHNCCDLFKPTIAERAEKTASGRFSDSLLLKAEERKPTSGRKGGGRKGGRGRGPGDTEEHCLKATSFMSLEEIATELTKSFSDCPTGFLTDVAAKIER